MQRKINHISDQKKSGADLLRIFVFKYYNIIYVSMRKLGIDYHTDINWLSLKFKFDNYI